MPERDHAEIEELLGAYALDALDADEAAVVREHLEGCPRCRAEVDAHREMAAALGNSVAPLPPSLWGRIADHLAPTHQADQPEIRPSLLRVPHEPATGIERDRATLRRPVGTSHRGGHSDLARKRRLSRWASVGIAAAAGAAIAILAVNLAHTHDQLGQTRRALSAEGSRGEIQAALVTPGHRLVRLRSSSGRQLAEIVLIPNGHGYVVSSTMRLLPRNETYQLWAIIDGRPISLGLMGSQPRQVAFTVASDPAPVALSVTVEPSGGVTTPDRSPIATGPVSA